MLLNFLKGNIKWDTYYLSLILKSADKKLKYFLFKKIRELQDPTWQKSLNTSKEEDSMLEIRKVVENLYDVYKDKIAKSISKFKIAWKNVESQFFEALYKILGIDISLPNKLFCFVGINPICPKNVKYRSFSLPFYISEKVAIKIIAHEVAHFYYADKVMQIDSSVKVEEFDHYSLAWLMSESIIPIILNESSITKIIGKISYKTYACDEKISQRLLRLYELLKHKEGSFPAFYKEAKALMLEELKHRQRRGRQ